MEPYNIMQNVKVIGQTISEINLLVKKPNGVSEDGKKGFGLIATIFSLLPYQTEIP